MERDRNKKREIEAVRHMLSILRTIKNVKVHKTISNYGHISHSKRYYDFTYYLILSIADVIQRKYIFKDCVNLILRPTNFLCYGIFMFRECLFL